MNITETIEKKSLIIKNVLGLPYIFVSKDGEVLFEEVHYGAINPLYKYGNQQSYGRLSLNYSSFSLPKLNKTDFFEIFIIFSVKSENEFIGTFVIGPCLSSTIDEQHLYSLINDYNAFSLKKQILLFYKNLSIIPLELLFTISGMLYAFFNQEIISIDDIKKFNLLNELSKNSQDKFKLAIKNNIQYKNFHFRLFENQILNIVRNGDINKLKSPDFKTQSEKAPLYSRTSFLRSLKNHVITLIALISRAAIDGGLTAEEAIGLNDTFILQVEESSTTDEVTNIAGQAIQIFTQKVHELEKIKYSPLINQCREYIFRHIFEAIQIESLAEELGISANYLSTVFKEETGETIIRYIQKAKVREAKQLLELSELSLSEIASYLSFSDQSYFTNVFKKHTGMTPLHYRQSLKPL